MEPSKIFQSYRALGFVNNHIPLTIRFIKVRREHLLTTVVNQCFHTYGSDHLKLLSISSPHAGDITCLASDKRYVYTACDRNIFAWKRGTEMQHKYVGHQFPVQLLLPFSAHLVSVDESNELRIWDIESQECVTELSFPANTFKVTALIHPSTYLNKILLGSEQGTLQLWNMRTLNILFTFQGWKSSVLVLEQAPAIDVVAVGLASGEIYLHNFKFDETVVKFTQEWGPVIGISFRTDNTPHMATASPIGHVAIWDLESRKVQSQIRHAHKGAVTGLKYLANEPCLATSSPDNSLKIWLFDQSDGSGRLLKLREGHSATPTKIKFYGSNGNYILSAGLDSTLRAFSLIRDDQNKNLGQASLNRKLAKKMGVTNDPVKLTPITDFACETNKEKEWDNIAACHRGKNVVTTWSFDKCRMGAHKLNSQVDKTNRNVALCVSLSQCGNFVVIGYNTGDVEKYNIQSGIFRGKYGNDKAHKGPVRGVAIDALSQVVITGGSDKRLAFWHFKSCKLIEEIELESFISSILLHRESGMIGVAQDDQSVVIVDQETRKVVRKFLDLNSTINGMTFSPDSRWLVIATMDKLIRTWDLPTGRLVDCFEVPSTCTSITMSPLGDFLATTHVDNLGIYLWCNTTLYSHVSLNSLPNDFIPKVASLPMVIVDGGTSENNDNMEMDEEISETIFEDVEQISEDLVTLSSLPYSHWRNLLSLDVIKEKNKPVKPIEKQTKAPFFLPTIAGLTPTFQTIIQDKGSEPSENLNRFSTLSAFGQLLLQCGENNNYAPILVKLKEMGPSMIDVELRTLSPDCGGSEELMECFLQAIDFGLRVSPNFELIQAYLALYLKLHANTLSCSSRLCEALEKIEENQKKKWIQFQSKINQSLCLVNYFRSALV